MWKDVFAYTNKITNAHGSEDAHKWRLVCCSNSIEERQLKIQCIFLGESYDYHCYLTSTTLWDATTVENEIFFTTLGVITWLKYSIISQMIVAWALWPNLSSINKSPSSSSSTWDSATDASIVLSFFVAAQSIYYHTSADLHLILWLVDKHKLFINLCLSWKAKVSHATTALALHASAKGKRQ